MNIENIAALAAQLQSLGFDNDGSALLKRIAFKPSSFIHTQKMHKGGDLFIFNLFFEKDDQENLYCLLHYDAILQKETVLTNMEINNIRLVELESKMSDLDWKVAFDFSRNHPWTASDKSSWDREQKVESVINALQQLETTEEGKYAAIGLKLKYWDGLPYQDVVGSVPPIKNKTDVSQRFYLSDGQPGISVNEAIRFLQNRWLEKQMQVKKKINESIPVEEEETGGKSSSGSGLLKKKRLNGSKSGKKNNFIRS